MNTYQDEVEAGRQTRQAWERLWNTYMDKVDRLAELKAQGRHGYQLRMPKKAIRIAHERLNQFEAEHGLSITQ